jgi:hypothetical protein
MRIKKQLDENGEQNSASDGGSPVHAHATDAALTTWGIVKRLPRWLLVFIILYLMVLVAYSVYSGATVHFWPPEIIPGLSATSPNDSLDLSKRKELSFAGSLSSQGKAKAHRFLLGHDKVIAIQPTATSSAALYFDLTVQSPSGNLRTIERFRSIKESATFHYTAAESGEYLLLVTMRPDGGAVAGDYFITVTEK